MIEIKNLFNFFKKNKINYFTGVPDSVLKATNEFFKNKSKNKHFITSNEGSAVAMAIGYHLATKKIPCVYMQNSGLSNALNPIISIAHKKVYSIPMLLLIGWRGSPGIKDEPQHELKGSITPELLKLLNIKFCILKRETDFKKLKKIIDHSKKNSQPVACLIEKNILKNLNKNKRITRHIGNLMRSDVINILLKKINKKTKLVATTGFTSRELHQIRSNKKIKNGQDFYMVGGMGYSSSVSLGISLRTTKNVICLDGDGSFLMHLGSLVSIGKVGGQNFKHILFNNFSHESVGGQTTNIEKLDIKKLIFSAGYKNFFKINKKNQLNLTLSKFLKSKGPSFLEIKIKPGSINNLKRPKNFIEIKKKFMENF